MNGFQKCFGKKQQLQQHREQQPKEISPTVLMNVMWSIPGSEGFMKLADCTLFFSLIVYIVQLHTLSVGLHVFYCKV